MRHLDLIMFYKCVQDKLIELSISLFFLIFYINLIIDDGINWGLNIILIFLFSILSIQRKIKFDWYLFAFIVPPFILIYCLDYLLFKDQISTDPHFNKNIAPEMVNHYLYALPLLLLPTILSSIKNIKITYVKIINFTIIVSVFFNAYINYFYELNRGLLAKKFEAIILYDGSIASLSIIALTLNMREKNTSSFIFVILSLINLYLIILHGSRGTWLGIPVALLIIIVFYFKKNNNKSLIVIASCILLTTLSLIIPNNPITNRIDDFNNDKKSLQTSSYHSSTGQRVFLWGFSIEKFYKSPIYGSGIKTIKDDICEQKKLGFIPECHSHVHNIFLQLLATNGLLGFLGILFVFITPLILYIRNLFNNDDLTQDFAIAGLSFTIFFLICGMTDFMFFFSFSTMFYFLTTSALITLIRNKV